MKIGRLVTAGLGVALLSIVISGCGTAKTTGQPVLSTTPITQVQSGYINGFSFSYPKNWSAVQPVAQQKNSASSSYAYGPVQVTVQNFPSLVASSAIYPPISLSSILPELNSDLSKLVSPISLLVPGTPVTIDQAPGITYNLSSPTTAGLVATGFTGQNQFLIVCKWSPAFAKVGLNGCDDIITTIAVYQNYLGGL